MKFKEDDLQMDVARYLDVLRLVWCHVPNERKTSHQAGVRLKKKGVKSGVPDCLIFNNNNKYNGFALELKVKPNKQTKNQNDWLFWLTQRGWFTSVAYNFDEAKEIIDNYLNNEL